MTELTDKQAELCERSETDFHALPLRRFEDFTGPHYRRRMQSFLVKLACLTSPTKGDSLSTVLDRAGRRRAGRSGLPSLFRALRAAGEQGA